MVKVEGKGFEKNGWYTHPPGVVTTEQFSNKWIQVAQRARRWGQMMYLPEFGADF